MTVKEFLHKDKYGDDKLVGTLLTLKNGKQLLVGNINTLGGVCDCCLDLMLEEEVEVVQNLFERKL